MCMSGSCLKTDTAEVNSMLALGNGAYILLRTSSEEAKRYSPVGMIVCVSWCRHTESGEDASGRTGPPGAAAFG